MPSTTTSPIHDRPVALMMLVAWSAALVIAMFFPHARLWGINLLAFASVEVRIGFACGTVLALILTVSHIRLPKLISRPAGLPYAIAVVIAVALIAWGLRAQEAFLGDGTLRANHALQPNTILASEILPTALASAIVRVAPASWAIDGFQALRLISVVSAVGLIAFLWWFVPLTVGDESRGLLLWILSFGSVRLFTGYIETYTPAFVFYSCWALAAWGYMHRRVGSGWLIGFWAMAMLSHVTAILLLPASLWVLARNESGDFSLKRRAFLSYLLVALGVGGVVVFTFFRLQVERIGVGTGHFFMALTSGPPNQYGLFSLAHIVDFVNHWLLLVPAFICAGVVHIWKDGRASIDSRRLALTPDTIFWILAAVIPIAAGFLIDPKLGWARDWDLFALLSAPALVGIAIWLDRLTGATRRAALSIAVLSAGLWLTFSVDGSAERRRFEALLDLDPSRSDYGHEILAQHYQRRGDHEGTIRHYRAALAVSENLRYRVNIAVAYYEMGKYDESETWSRGVIARDSANASAHHGLSLVLSATGHPEEAVLHSLRATTLERRNIDYAMQHALALIELGRYPDALPVLQRISRASPNAAAPFNALSVCYLAMDSAAAAKSSALSALRISPAEPMMWLNAASAAFREQSWPEAAQYLEEYKSRTPASKLHPEALGMLDSLRRLPGVP